MNPDGKRESYFSSLQRNGLCHRAEVWGRLCHLGLCTLVFTQRRCLRTRLSELSLVQQHGTVCKWGEFTACSLCVWFLLLLIVRAIDGIAYCHSLFSLIYIILLYICTTLCLFCSWWIFCVVFLFPLGVCLYRNK